MIRKRFFLVAFIISLYSNVSFAQDADPCYRDPDTTRVSGRAALYTTKVVNKDTAFFTVFYNKEKTLPYCTFTYYVDKPDRREVVKVRSFFLHGRKALECSFKNYNGRTDSIHPAIATGIEFMTVTSPVLLESEVGSTFPVNSGKDSSYFHSFTQDGIKRLWNCDGTLQLQATYVPDLKAREYTYGLYEPARPIKKRGVVQTREITYTRQATYLHGALTYNDGIGRREKALYDHGFVVWDSLFFDGNAENVRFRLTVITPHLTKKFTYQGKLVDSTLYKPAPSEAKPGAKKEVLEDYHFVYYPNGGIKSKEIILKNNPERTFNYRELFDETGKTQSISAHSQEKGYDVAAEFMIAYDKNKDLEIKVINRAFVKSDKLYKAYHDLPDSLVQLSVRYQSPGKPGEFSYQKKDGEFYAFTYYAGGQLKSRIHGQKKSNAREGWYYYENGKPERYFLNGGEGKGGVEREYDQEGKLTKEEEVN